MLSDKQIQGYLKKAKEGKLTTADSIMLRREMMERQDLCLKLEVALGLIKPGFIVECGKCHKKKRFGIGEEHGIGGLDVYGTTSDTTKFRCDCGNEYER